MTDVVRDGGPAFPRGVSEAQRGMSLRDWFAGQAVERMISLAQDRDGGWDQVAVAVGCYQVADAMLDARDGGDRGEPLRHLASAVRKLLPPKLLREVLGHLDPLVAFKQALQEGGDRG